MLVQEVAIFLIRKEQNAWNYGVDLFLLTSSARLLDSYVVDDRRTHGLALDIGRSLVGKAGRNEAEDRFLRWRRSSKAGW